MTPPRTAQVPVPTREPLLGDHADYDYADAFEIRLAAPDGRSAEAFTRDALDGAPWPVRTTIRTAHRYVLRLRLGPRSSPAHLFGWKIVTSEPDVVQLEAVSPLLGRGVIVARRPDPTSAMVTTYVFFTRRATASAVWAMVAPVHRLVVPLLLDHVAATRRSEDLAAVR
jgi:hypothetical protein